MGPQQKKKTTASDLIIYSFCSDVCMNIETDFPNVVALPCFAGFNVAYLICLALSGRLLERLQCDRPFRLGSLEL
jgi:hypothetical protein